MSSLNYKNPISPIYAVGSFTAPREEVFGVTYSVLNVGGYMEVYTLDDLNYTIPIGQSGSIKFSGNTIPIEFSKSNGSPTSFDTLTLSSDNISSGRRRLGMLAYVYEVNQVYQYCIDDYDILWSNATGATGPGGNTVTISDFGTIVKSNSLEGIAFNQAWLSSDIEDVNGVTRANARWRKFHTDGGAITGGSYNSATTTLTLFNVTGGTIQITGFTTGGGGGPINVAPNTALGFTGSTLFTIYNTLVADAVTSVEVGGSPAGVPASTWKTRNLVEVLDSILFPDVPPTYTIPTISIGGISSQVVEVGDTIVSNITASATKNDAGAFTQLRVLRNGSPLFTDVTLTSSAAGNVPPQFGYNDPNNPNFSYSISPTPYTDTYVIPGVGTTIYTVDGDYNSGLPKQNNKGVFDTRPAAVRSFSAPQLGDTNFTSSSIVYTAIYPYFWGVSASAPSAASIAADIAAGLTNQVLSSAAGTIVISFGASSQYLWFAVQSAYPAKTRWYVDPLNQGDIGGASNLFNTPITQSVNSPNFYWSGINFEIYISNYQTSTFGTMELRNS